MRNIWIAALMILVSACGWDKISSSLGGEVGKPGMVNIKGVEFPTMPIVEGQSAMNRLAVCTPSESGLDGKSVTKDSLVARPMPSRVSLVKNDSVTKYCLQNSFGYEARVYLDGIRAGKTAITVEVWLDPKMKSSMSFDVDVSKAP